MNATATAPYRPPYREVPAVLLPIGMDRSGIRFQDAAGHVVAFVGGEEFTWVERPCGVLGRQRVVLASIL